MRVRFSWRSWMQRLASSRRGNVAMMWALTGVAMISLTGLTVDFTRAADLHSRMQSAADAAALSAQRDPNLTTTERTKNAKAFFDAQMGPYASGSTFSVEYESEDTIAKVTATAKIQGGFTALFNPEGWTVGVVSNATQSGQDLEVSLVLDTSGSMAGTKMSTLISAADELIDTVVRDDQTPFYSRAAIVPFSTAVNMGSSKAASARGAATAAATITNAKWASGSALNITGATKANPVVITSNNHGFANGDTVYITGVKGMTQLNGKIFTVANKTTNTFQLSGVNGSSYSTYTSSGTVTKCLVSGCNVVVTASNHGFSTNDYVVISNVSGMTQINNSSNAAWQVTKLTTDTFSLNTSTGPSYNAYSSGGSAYCTTFRCTYYRFTSASGSIKIYQMNNCVSERTGTNAFTNAAITTAQVNPIYTSGGSDCPSTTIQPLTSDKDTLKAKIDSLAASGNTSGHLGLTWGYYTLSPGFGFLGGTAPAAYGTPKLAKILVLMTDGAFNVAYCNGVVSRDSGSSSSYNSCYAPNGDSFTQGNKLCDAMKKSGIRIYTVGFQLASEGQTAVDLVTNCASSPNDVYLAESPAALTEAFRKIAASISQLRITH